ncbi:ABC transporter ATP-binding protein [bacterium]|uniref:ABC transporter domain-containing protein n=1 Tax=candidate division WWE3 bacterium CG_4_9_14_3_um_filter_39_7 TaxID=1975080 RepID=A0A2M7X1M4_UNCKA|nr:ABC transporter ATP-binding protein [bacterium]PJA40074.1 MAG: hypothetical protein CO179_03535 [candidate division WWE3 bacterium CG_4_9_14_3_um_filter_39_7]
MAVIKVANLVKKFGHVTAVNDISFTVDKGEIVGFLGPNGAGKTTTIRTIMGFLNPTQGEVVVFDDTHTPSHELRDKIGFLSGEIHLYEDWSVREHLELIAHIRNISTSYARELSHRFTLDTKRKVKQLSSGNKQKLAITMALMHRPELVILDEPTNGLDPLLQNSLYELLHELAQEGTTIFMSSHNLSEVERVCDRVIIIKQGKIVANEHVGEIAEKRMYKIDVSFDQKPSSEIFNLDTIEVISETETGFLLRVSGNVQPALNLLSKQLIADIQISHANLEEVFLEYYK